MGKNWSLGYWLLKFYIDFAWWIFHRKIIILGKENIPDNKPVIYASNHQNALSDALALVCSVPQQTVWLARADIFRSAFSRPSLKFLKIIPVYRIRDGIENLSKDEKTFAESVRILKKNGALGIFPEAAHSGRRQMLPHKKAIPRIVFMAEKMTGFSLDIQVVPVGIYYDQYFNFGRRLMVLFGKPLPVLDYREKYLQNEQQAAISLRDDLQTAILGLIVNFKTPTHYAGFEAIRKICTEKSESGKKDADLPGIIEQGQRITEKLDELEALDPARATLLSNKALSYLKMLVSFKLRSWLVDENEEKPNRLFVEFCVLVLTFPVFALGFLFNGFPFILLDRVIKKRVKEAVFKSTFSFAVGIFLFPLAYWIEILLVSPLLPGWLLKTVFLLSLPFTGKFAFSWYIQFLKTLGRRRWLKIKRKDPGLYKEIHRRKEEIVSSVI